MNDDRAMIGAERYVAKHRAFAVLTSAAAFTLVLGTGSSYDLNRAPTWGEHLQRRVPFFIDAPKQDFDRPDLRTGAQHIENIRTVLKLSMAELATLFNVSRQATYKWLAGTSVPEIEKLDRLRAFSKIADVLRIAGVTHPGSLLKMRAFDGKSLLDLFSASQNLPEHISVLIREAQAIELAYQRSGLNASKAKPTQGWQSYISIPGSSELS
jgi:transcriptional regulator with XRE-family HTH domain